MALTFLRTQMGVLNEKIYLAEMKSMLGLLPPE
jgi:hypothetical protein